MNSPRRWAGRSVCRRAGRSTLTAVVILLAGMTAACGLGPYNGPIGTVAKGMVTKSTVALGSLSAGPVAIIPFDQPDAKLIKVGEPAVLTFEAVPGLQVIGTVQAIVPINSNIVQKTIYQATIAVSSNDPRMKPGQNVRGSVATFTVPNVLVVPNSAIHYEDGGSYVTGADGNHVPFTAGAAGDDVTEVRSGLTDGQQVRLK